VVVYWFPLIIGLFCSIMICIGLRKRNKNLIIIFSLLPPFFASPFYTATRGAAGAITASDFTGIVLWICLLFFPKNWKSPYRILSVRLLTLWMMIMGLSIFTTGVIYNCAGIVSSQMVNIRFSNTLVLPVLIASFRFFKLLTLFSYCAFFYVIYLNEKNIKWILNTIIFGSVLLAAAQILTRFDIIDFALAYGDTYNQYIGPRILGLTKASVGRILFVGIFLTLVTFNQDHRILSIFAMIIMTGGLVLSGSRGGIAALMVGLIPIYFFGRIRGVVIGGFFFAVILISAILTLSYNEMMVGRLLGTLDTRTVSTASTRMPIWINTIKILIDNPMIILFGVGAFNFSYAGLSLNFEHAHNDILTIGCELGLISMIIFIIWLVSLAILLYGNILRSSGKTRWRNLCILGIFVGLCFGSQFEPTFYPSISTLPMLRILLPLLLAVGLFRHKNQ
jgi:O-antigen ligase